MTESIEDMKDEYEEKRLELADRRKKIRRDITDLQDQMDSFELEGKEGTDDYKVIKINIRNAEKQVSAIDSELDSLKRQYSYAARKDKELTVAEQQKQDTEVILNAAKLFYMGYVIAGHKFHMCKNTSTDINSICNPRFQEFTEQEFVHVLNKITKRQLSLERDDVIALFEKNGLSYFTTTASMSQVKYNGSDYYNKAGVIRNFWCKPNRAEAGKYDPHFDILMYCLGGGKNENIEHLERWVLQKLKHPEAAATTPNLDIGGNPGGNGKGLFAQVLMKTIFTPACVTRAAVKEAGDNFNANHEMAVIINYDEPEEGELKSSVLKKATGSQDMRIEKKGIDAITVDRLASEIYTSNNVNGVVPLSGAIPGSQDRRFSVMTTNITLVGELMAANNWSKEMAADYIQKSLVPLLENRTEVERWLGHIDIKHDAYLSKTPGYLAPLHGHDYSKRIGDQKTDLQLILDYVLTQAMKDGGISVALLDLVMSTTTGQVKKWTKIFTEHVVKTGRNVDKQTSVDVEYRFDDKIGPKSTRKNWISIDGGSQRCVQLSNYITKEPKSTKDWISGIILSDLALDLQEAALPNSKNI